MFNGSCACGAITFTVQLDELPAPDACHCTQCRKFSGHYFVSSDVPKSAFKLGDSSELLRWYPSSIKNVRRGFCSRCGSSLFWDPTEREWIGVAMGAFDQPTETITHVHVYTREKGDYYTLADDTPQWETVPPS